MWSIFGQSARRLAPAESSVSAQNPRDIVKLWSAAVDDEHLTIQDRALLALVVGEGVRPSELARMEPADVDVRRGSITLKDSRGAARKVTVSEIVRDLLALHLEVNTESLEYLWTWRGKRMSARAVSKRFQMAASLDQKLRLAVRSEHFRTGSANECYQYRPLGAASHSSGRWRHRFEHSSDISGE